MVDVKTITHDRLWSWEQRLIESHATPAFLLGIGHDHVSGKIVICVTSDRTDAEIIAFLEIALKSLKGLK